MNYRQALEYIHSQKRFGPKPGLERIQKLLSLLGNPQDRLRFVHVAGTNGKGSTTVMTASVFQEAGYKTGVFISPYVLDFRERIQVDREMISEAALTRLVEQVKPFVEQMRADGEIVAEFELVTALAMCYFEQQRCDIVCLEVGIGGRFDSTNVIAPPLAAVITAISLDHTQMLGGTVEQIASEKAGIIKRNTDVICYAKQDPGALAVLMQRCAETGSRLILPSAGSVEIKSLTAFGSDFVYGEEEYHIRLAGEHQVYNALSAIETIRVLQNKGFAVREQQLKNGLANAKFPARFEVLHEHPMIVLDGAHNPDGAKALATTLRLLGEVRIAAVVGMLAEKEVDALLSEIGPLCTRIVAVDIDSPRALGRDALCAEASAYCADCRSALDYIEAIRLAAEVAGEDGVVIIFGSLYLAAEIREFARTYKN